MTKELKTFDVTLRTKIREASRAEATEYLRAHVDLDGLSYDSEISAEEESAKPHLGEHHPANVATYAVLDALGLADDLPHEAAASITDALANVPRLIAEVWYLALHNEKCLEELRAENVRMSHEVDAARNSYLALMAEYEADKKLWAQIEAWNTRLVSQIKIVRTARQLTTSDAIPHSLRIAP